MCHIILKLHRLDGNAQTFKLGLGSPWENSDSEKDSETVMDKLLLTALLCYEAEQDKQNGSVDTPKSNCTLQEPRKIVLKTSFLEYEQYGKEKDLTIEIDEFLLMVS